MFDDALRGRALEAGAVPSSGRAERPVWGRAPVSRVRRWPTGADCTADFVIGADGATSHVADARRPGRRPPGCCGASRCACYLDQPVELPPITLWEPTRWRAFPGYGWIFPGPDGVANVGLGIGTLADRQSGPGRCESCRPISITWSPRPPRPGADGSGPAARLGGWLKMGMVGTTPAAGRVLLVGRRRRAGQPAAGRGHRPGHDQRPGGRRGRRSAPRAGPPTRYRSGLARAHLPYQRISRRRPCRPGGPPRAPLPRWGGLLTAPLVGRALAGGWGIFWNELLDGAAPGGACKVAAGSTLLGRAVTAGTDVSRWFTTAFDDG